MAIHNNKLFFGPKHNIYAFFIMLFGLFDLRVLFVCQICHVNCETIENKRYFWIIKYQVNWTHQVSLLKHDVNFQRSLRALEGEAHWFPETDDVVTRDAFSARTLV